MNRRGALVLAIFALWVSGFSDSTCSAATYGNTTPFNTQSSHSPDYVLGVQVAIPEILELISFGVIYGHPNEGQPSASNAIFGLYDSAGPGGNPGSLVANTNVVHVNAITTYTFNFNSNPTVAPGTYWMMALYETNANPRMDLTDPTSLVAYFSQPFAQGMPATAPAITNYSGQNFNYWINGNSIPEPSSLGLLGIAGLIGLKRPRRHRK